MGQKNSSERRMQRYRFHVRWSGEDKEYVATVAEIPGLSWLDSSPDAALKGVQKVTEEAVEDMVKNGVKPPESSAERSE